MKISDEKIRQYNILLLKGKVIYALYFIVRDAAVTEKSKTCLL